jgi:hypothetical protein
MELIDKEKVAKEIKKVYDEGYKFLPSDLVESVDDFKDELLRVLDTLETKEVDLEKEFDRYCDCKNLSAIDIEEAPFTEMYACARYFFELGFNARKGK